MGPGRRWHTRALETASLLDILSHVVVLKLVFHLEEKSTLAPLENNAEDLYNFFCKLYFLLGNIPISSCPIFVVSLFEVNRQRLFPSFSTKNILIQYKGYRYFLAKIYHFSLIALILK